jgi:hypothetical protein
MGPPSYMRSVVNRNVVTWRIPVFQFVRWLPPSDSRTSGDLGASIATLAFFFSLLRTFIYFAVKAYWYERNFMKSYIPLCGPWEANSCARNQEIQPILWNVKVRYVFTKLHGVTCWMIPLHTYWRWNIAAPFTLPGTKLGSTPVPQYHAQSRFNREQL